MRMLLTLLLLAPAALNAAETPAKAVACQACHGVGGGAPVMDMYPKINGQNKTYLVNVLKGYRSGDRKGGMAPVMYGQAAGLSDDDIDELANYYSSQP